MKLLSQFGLLLFCAALVLFTLSLGLNQYQLTEENLPVQKEFHRNAILDAARESGTLGRTYGSSFSFVPAIKKVVKRAQEKQLSAAAESLPEEVSEWDFKIGDWEVKPYVQGITKASAFGLVAENAFLFLLLTIGMGALGGLLFALPYFFQIPGIKHNHIFHSSMTRGLRFWPRALFLGLTMVGILVYGFFYLNGDYFWPVLSAVISLIIIGLVFGLEKQSKNNPPRSAAPKVTGWLGILTGIYLIAFYLLLYWFPEHLTSWMLMADPLSVALSGNEASQWFVYGLLYTVVVLVMGVRMIGKYRHNRYQMIRTGSVMFFQLAFAFLIPEILVRLNYPYFDFKNIWPLNYTFFFDWNLNSLLESGALGLFMLVWGIVLIVIAVPVITYFYGKRWYCSWVCGCGGLAETLGDPYRQLSDKSLRAWKFERWIIHGVLVAAVVMTALVLYTFFSGQSQLGFLNSYDVRTWYGFLIGSAFAGVVGTGFYPLMGNRMWCRFGCPLAAYLGLVQRFKSRFRITTNGGQCISCGNCSTYCEMGIDVRWYAQRGQDVVRSSCVGCGVCAAVCPRGVLRLENGPDVSQRATELRALHITKEGVKLEA
jgi:polyferredoxin